MLIRNLPLSAARGEEQVQGARKVQSSSGGPWTGRNGISMSFQVFVSLFVCLPYIHQTWS